MNLLKRLKESIDYRVLRLYRERCFPPLEISSKEAEQRVFCFLGEFGFELFCWAPYLRFLKDRLNFRMRVAGRAGGRLFYDFADDYIEVPSKYFAQGMAQPEHYFRLERALKIGKLFNPLETKCSGENSRYLSVESFAYSIGSLYRPGIRYDNALPLDLSGINDPLPFETSKPIAVIANKSYSQFGRFAIKNFYDRDELQKLKQCLSAKGFFIVYNHFPEPKNEKDDSYFDFDGSTVFNDKSNCFNFENVYKAGLPVEAVNRLQVSLYNKASVAITTQGGTLYIPAICGVPSFCLMRHGYYNEVKNIASVCKVPIRAFYEVDDMLLTINTGIPVNRQLT